MQIHVLSTIIAFVCKTLFLSSKEGQLKNDSKKGYIHTSEMEKVIKIAELHFWPKKISTKKWPKNDPK